MCNHNSGKAFGFPSLRWCFQFKQFVGEDLLKGHTFWESILDLILASQFYPIPSGIYYRYMYTRFPYWTQAPHPSLPPPPSVLYCQLKTKDLLGGACSSKLFTIILGRGSEPSPPPPPHAGFLGTCTWVTSYNHIIAKDVISGSKWPVLPCIKPINDSERKFKVYRLLSLPPLLFKTCNAYR